MNPEAEAFGAQSSDIEPGMNIISADFDLIMVNRPNERLYGKPVVELLGKKCYREFEKREAPCSHCPGRRSLLTGETHEAETEGLRDDGTWFSARVRTHPLQGLGDVPTGFIEVVEDITEEKRAEKLGYIEADLRTALGPVQNIRRALTITFESALRVESVDAGCVFLLGGAPCGADLVVSQGLSEESLRVVGERVSDLRREDPFAGLSDAPRSSATIAIQHRGEVVAVMVAAGLTYPAIPPTLVAGLHSLGATVSAAIGRIWAEQSRGDAVADLEAIITHAPMAAFILDRAGKVTMWNRAAEHLFGWRASEVVKRPCPFPRYQANAFCGLREPLVQETTLRDKNGRPVDVRATATPFRDLVGVASAIIIMMEDLTPGRRLLELEARLRDLESRPAAPESCLDGEYRAGHDHAAYSPETTPQSPRRVLLLNAEDASPHSLPAIFARLGYEPVSFPSLPDALDGIAEAGREARPFALAVVELVSTDGASGLTNMAALRAAGLEGPVLLSSDSEVRGYREHGFAGALRRPYEDEEVRRAVRDILGARTEDRT